MGDSIACAAPGPELAIHRGQPFDRIRNQIALAARCIRAALAALHLLHYLIKSNINGNVQLL